MTAPVSDPSFAGNCGSHRLGTLAHFLLPPLFSMTWSYLGRWSASGPIGVGQQRKSLCPRRLSAVVTDVPPSLRRSCEWYRWAAVPSPRSRNCPRSRSCSAPIQRCSPILRSCGRYSLWAGTPTPSGQAAGIIGGCRVGFQAAGATLRVSSGPLPLEKGRGHPTRPWKHRWSGKAIFCWVPGCPGPL